MNIIIPSSKKKIVRVEGKDKEKEEALVKEKQTEYKKKKVAMMKEKNQRIKEETTCQYKNKEKPVNKIKVYTIEKITNHKCAKGNKKVTSLLIKWEGYPQLTWESLSWINAKASGMVKTYLDRKNLKS